MTHLLTSIGAASLLGITSTRLGRLVREQAVPTVELPDGAIRFDRRELERCVEGWKRPAALLPSGK